MLSWLINWKLIISGIGVLSLLLSFAYIRHLHSEISQLKLESRQNMEAYMACYQSKEKERLISNEFQTKARNLRSQLVNANRLRPKCLLPQSETPPGSGGASSGAVILGGDGINTGYLIDFAGRCETERLKLIGCQKLCGGVNESSIQITMGLPLEV